jgi:hypothetical protein
VLAAGDRVVKAYDLRAFDGIGRQRARAEMEAALALSDIDGVVTTYQTGTVGDWLIIEMDRLGESVADHLVEVEAGRHLPLGRERWGSLLDRAARALDGIHRRGLVHRDVKPANLMFDRDGERVLVGDFSISSTRPRRFSRRGRAGPTPPQLGTTRYVAPEQFDGRVGPAADQYALGITAGDVLGDDVTPSARDVLLRATAHEPEDRFGSIADFGVALRSALDDTAPRRLSSRLQRVSPLWRHTWGSAGAVALTTYAGLIAARPAGLTWSAGLILPLLAGAATALASRTLSGLRGHRSQPRARFADRPWFPLAMFAAAIAALSPLIVYDPRDTGKYVLYSAFGSLTIAGLLGATPRNAGEWLIGIVRRWENWRERQRGHRVRWWGVRAVAALMLAGLSALPAAVGARWPNDTRPSIAADSGPAVVVARSRAAMFSGDVRAGCALIRVPRDARLTGCSTWFRVASAWLLDDVRSRGGPRFEPSELDRVTVHYIDRSERHGAPTWSLRAKGGARPYVGNLSKEDEGGRVWGVSLTRSEPQDDVLTADPAEWRYEVVRDGDGWVISAIEICAFSERDACITVTQVKRSEWPAVARRGAPG